MVINHIKITNAKELLQKYFLGVDERSLLYLQQYAEDEAIYTAENNGWIKKYTQKDGSVLYRITDKGRKILSG